MLSRNAEQIQTSAINSCRLVGSFLAFSFGVPLTQYLYYEFLLLESDFLLLQKFLFDAGLVVLSLQDAAFLLTLQTLRLQLLQVLLHRIQVLMDARQLWETIAGRLVRVCSRATKYSPTFNFKILVHYSV